MARLTKEDVDNILKDIESGMSENKACEKHKVHRSTFRQQVLKHNIDAEYARALAGLATDQVEKLEVAIEDMRSGKIDHHVARVEIDARKWFASKFLPKQYGDHLQVESDSTVTHKFEDMDDDQLDRAIAETKDQIT